MNTQALAVPHLASKTMLWHQTVGEGEFFLITEAIPDSLGLVFGQTDFYVERDIQITPGSKVFKAMNPCVFSMYYYNSI